MSKNKHVCSRPEVLPAMNKQSGAVLVIGLLILLVLTIIGITGMTSTSMQERMAGNDRSRQVAFQSAESALRTGEEYLRGSTYAALNSFPTTLTPLTSNCVVGVTSAICANCVNGFCARATGSSYDSWLDSTVWSDTSKYRTYADNFPETVSDPKYIIEDFGRVYVAGYTSGPNDCITIVPSPCPNMYRITALGIGTSGTSRVMVQSMFRKEP